MVWVEESRDDVLGVMIDGDGVEEGRSCMDGKREGERGEVEHSAVSIKTACHPVRTLFLMPLRAERV